MAALENIVRERNAAALQLEHGHTGDRPTRRTTTFAGFVREFVYFI